MRKKMVVVVHGREERETGERREREKRETEQRAVRSGCADKESHASRGHRVAPTTAYKWPSSRNTLSDTLRMTFWRHALRTRSIVLFQGEKLALPRVNKKTCTNENVLYTSHNQCLPKTQVVIHWFSVPAATAAFFSPGNVNASVLCSLLLYASWPVVSSHKKASQTAHYYKPKS